MFCTGSKIFTQHLGNRRPLPSLIRLFAYYVKFDDSVQFHEENNAGIITLNRPATGNDLDAKRLNQIASKLRRWEPSKAVVIVRSSSPDIFSVGTDKRALVEGHLQSARQYYYELYRLAHLIGSYDKPYVSLVNGVAQGAGLGLAVHGRYRVATEKTQFSMPELQFGTVPDAGASHFLPRLEGRLGMYLGLTGTQVDGLDVTKCGIGTHFCQSGELDRLQRRLISCCTDADVALAMGQYRPHDVKQPHALSRYMEQINLIFDAETVDQIVAFLKRDETDWSRRTLQEFAGAAPTSLKVAHRQLRVGKNLNLIDCMRMDYRVSLRGMEAGDFAEGVRAKLIDKDERPKWRVRRIEDVEEQRVQRYFEPFASQREELRPIR